MKISVLILIYFVVFISKPAWALEGDIWGTANPICSDKGLTIFFLNGVLNTKEGNRKSLELITDAINMKSPLLNTHERILDENDVAYEPLWNNTWGPLDLAIVALQKLKERLVIDGDVYNKLRARYKSDSDELPNEHTFDYAKDLVKDVELERIIEGYKKELSDSLVDSFAKQIIEAIDRDNKKVIVVAHSQGNLYLNEVILRVLGVRPDLKEKMDRYFATVYVASPAHDIGGVNSSNIKLSNDKVTGWMGNQGQYNVISSHPFWYIYHEFGDIYLRDDIIVEGNYSMRDVFLKALYDRARSFYANCCRSSYGGRVAQGALHPNGMGWVSNPNNISPQLEVNKAAEICGSLTIAGTGRVDELVHIRGSGTIKNFSAWPIDFKNPDKYLGFAKGVQVPRFETPMILIEDSDIENAGIFIEDIESNNPSISPMAIIRSSSVKNTGMLRNAVIDNNSTVDGLVSITELSNPRYLDRFSPT